MQSFKTFLEGSNPTPFNKGRIITATPVHGGHAKPTEESTIIDKTPMHGGHSKPSRKKIKEERENSYPLDIHGNQHVEDFSHRNFNSHIGPDLSSVHRKLDMSWSEFNRLPQSHSLKRYAENSYDTNNELIRHITGGYSSMKANPYDTPYVEREKAKKRAAHQEHVRSLDDSFNHPSATLKHDLHVFHGTNKFNPGEEARKGGGRITLPSYTSTSIHPKIALQFSGRGIGHSSHIIHLHMKKNQRGHYLGSNSHFDNEKEFLLPRNQTIQIHPTPTIVHNGEGNKIHIWHGHVVDQPTKRPDDVHKDQLKFDF